VSVTGEAAVHAPVPEPVAKVLLGNLVKNAFAYTPAGSVEVHLAPGAWTVRDTGVGFSAPDGRTAGGFGIGLSLVERLARHHGWTLAHRARAPEGTEVVLTWDPSPSPSGRGKG
jgi:signal transduction histidine kinase